MRSFCFILNLVDVDTALPYELLNNHTFDKADNEQVTKIKDVLHRFSIFSPHGFLYECTLEEFSSEDGRSTSYQRVGLPPEKWRYWVINFEGYNQEVQNIQCAVNLLKYDLDIGFQVIGDSESGSFMWNHVTLFNYYSDPSRFAEKPVTIGITDLKEMSLNYNMIKNLGEHHYDLRTAIVEFNNLKVIHGRSTMKTIGYISIIESLITHRPKLSESIDSIMHQINTKMLLLNKRFVRPINICEYFDGANEASIWKKLYSYRSEMVHGGKPDFKNEYKLLKNRDNVNSFLKESNKSLLVFALQEPDFVSDLKKC